MTVLDPILVVIPALNEETSVGEVVSEVQATGFDVCVIEDGSSDATAAVAAAAGAKVVRFPVNLGVGAALRCGFRYAVREGYATVLQVDADRQHHPGEIPVLLERMRATGADMVIGTRFDEGSPAFDVRVGRRLAMRLLAWRATRALGTRITDATSGLRVIRRPLLEEFAHSYPVEYLGDTLESIVVAGRRGRCVAECPVRMSPRAAGRSSAGLLAGAWYVLRVLLAIELTRSRRRRLPTPMPSTEGEP